MTDSSMPMVSSGKRSDWRSLVRSLLAVTVVAVLVWLFAEGESLQRATLTVAVDVEAGESGLGVLPDESVPGLVRVDDRWQLLARLEVEGPSATISRLRDSSKLAAAITPDPSLVGLRPDPGAQVIDLRAAIEDRLELNRQGVRTVLSEPSNIPVQVVRLERVEVDLVASTDGRAAVSDAQVVPSRVTITLSAASAEQLRADIEHELADNGSGAGATSGGASESDQDEDVPDVVGPVFVRVSPSSLTGLVAGRANSLGRSRVEVPAYVRADPFFRISAESATVVVTGVESDVVDRRSGVPIQIMLPALLNGEIVARPADRVGTMQWVEIKGPAEDIARLGAARVVALARADFPSLAPGEERRVTAQISIAVVGDEAPRLSFTFEPRTVELIARGVERSDETGGDGAGVP